MNFYLLAGAGILYESRTDTRLKDPPPEFNELFPEKLSISGQNFEVVLGGGMNIQVSTRLSIAPRYTFGIGGDGPTLGALNFAIVYDF